MRSDFNTFHVMWAIRDTPAKILTSKEKVILYTLLACSGSDNTSWHSQSNLIEMCSISESSLKRSLKTLEQKTFIIVNRPTHSTHRITNQYRLNLNLILSYSKLKSGFTMDSDVQSRGSQRTQSGFTENPSRGSPRPIKKESKKEKRNARETPPPDGGVSPQREVMRTWYDDYHDECDRKEAEEALKKKQAGTIHH